jgi:very-short-patch-repair endonuclease
MPNTSVLTPEQQQIRERLVLNARDAWKRRLIDFSRRNNLLYYKPLSNQTLELPVSPELMQFAAEGGSLTISELLHKNASNVSNLLSIGRKGLENLEEKGLSTLYLVLGKCSWAADDDGRDPSAPLFLIPISLEFKGQDIEATEIEIKGEVEVNPVLIQVLNEQLNVKVKGPELLAKLSPALDEDVDAGDAQDEERQFDLNAVLGDLAARAQRIEGFKAEPFAVIGNFSFQKLAMVKDLEKRAAELVESDVVAAIAGDSSARRTLATSRVEVDPKGLDSVPPNAEFAVMEADSSQQCAIAGIAAGQSAVVHGPPGTGKSQTITNLIATLAATGKKVLFVAEKRAALEVVMNRLTSVGLDHLAIDLHGAEQAPKKVMEQVAKTLNIVRDAALPNTDGVHSDFSDRREKLNKHDERLHKVHAPLGLSVYQMQGVLLRLSARISSSVRWRGAELDSVTGERAKQIKELLVEAAGFESLVNRSDPSPWCGIELDNAQSAQNALDAVTRIAQDFIPQFVESLRRISEALDLRNPSSMMEAEEFLTLVRQSNSTLSDYSPDVFRESESLAASLAPGWTGGLKGIWVRLVDGSYKSAFKRAVALRTAGSISGKQVFEEVSYAAGIWKAWQKWATQGGVPQPENESEPSWNLYQRAQADLDLIEKVCKVHSRQATISALLEQVSKLAADSTAPYRVSRVCEIERNLASLGMRRLVDEIRNTHQAAVDWMQLFDYTLLQSVLDKAALNDPGIRTFTGSTHNGYVDDFTRLDLKRLELATARARRAHAQHAVNAMNQFPDQETAIRSEAAKSRRHKPLRKVFSEAKDVLTSVCPCWMASPLSVCQLIDGTGIFDYVIFDEASQVLPEDAIPSILRAKHVIVAGDNKQLPPTAFFAAAEEEDDSEIDATGYESLLDMMIPFVKGFYLNWHYRSHDEALISFSNRHIYDDRLVTFPGAGTAGAVSHVHVDWIPNADAQEESSAGEVREVVEMILSHARISPDLSLGVITMGIKHMNRIQAALDRALSKNTDLAEFFDTGRYERFFIKNLERVQGDERDVIILSVGYGKDRAGNLPLRFGPILSAGGRRRLNVAATRAKERVVVVSSFLHSDINSAQVRPGTGLEFLKNYIEYAGSGGKLLSGEHSKVPLNDFEQDIFDALSAKGITLVPQVGCSSFRIDMAACHPDSPGKLILAIECDGASYHSSYTARDRDRLRQQQLERLGWTFHRIWSTDWFLRRDEEVDRALHAFRRAVERSNGFPTQHSGETSALDSVSQLPSASPSPRSAPTPPIPIHRSIGDYTRTDLRNLLCWVKSDGRLRTNDELADEMFSALPFERRGSKIDAALREAIAQG